MPSPDEVDDEIKQYGWPAVRENLHRLGREPTPEEIEAAERKHTPWRFEKKTHEHEWVEDESGQEPPVRFLHLLWS